MPALIFFVLVQRYLIAGWGAGAVKGRAGASRPGRAERLAVAPLPVIKSTIRTLVRDIVRSAARSASDIGRTPAEAAAGRRLGGGQDVGESVDAVRAVEEGVRGIRAGSLQPTAG